MFLDYSRQRMTGETMKRLVSLADAANLRSKIKAMATGARINVTENRSVLHMALRAPRTQVCRSLVDDLLLSTLPKQ